MEPLELAVLTRLLDGDGPTLEVLRRQLAVAQVQSRDHTGVGFCLNFDVPAEAERLSFKELQLEGCDAVIPGLSGRAGFVLWIADGVLDALEGFTYSNEPWPADVGAFELVDRVSS